MQRFRGGLVFKALRLCVSLNSRLASNKEEDISGLRRGLCGVIDSGLVGSTVGGVPREQKMLKGHLPRVIYHQVYLYTKIKGSGFGVWRIGFGVWGLGFGF